MSNYHIGVKFPSSRRIDFTVLEDGNYLMSGTRDLKDEIEENQKLRHDRSYHLSELTDALYEFAEAAEAMKHTVSIIVEAVDYDLWNKSQRALVELAQCIGAIMSLPYKVHEVSQWTWKNAIIGKGGVTQPDVEEAVNERFGLKETLSANPVWYDTFCLARFGYVKDQPDTGA